MRTLVTGGLGYIGSHTVIDLLEHGFDVTIVDNLENCCLSTLDVIRQNSARKPRFEELDVRDEIAIARLLKTSRIEAVLHFAAKKSPAESLERPTDYFSTNVSGTVSLLSAMQASDVRNLVFSSSASVYGNASRTPIDESAPLEPLSPYAESKLLCERILETTAALGLNWKFRTLRYFNPVGAHPSGSVGENPLSRATNLFPVVMRVIAGADSHLSIYGDNFVTEDGTGVRDYIHVCDIAAGHRMALQSLSKNSDYECVNLGTGRGYSVLEVITAFEKLTGIDIPHRIAERRPADPASSVADISKAKRFLGWEPRLGLADMVRDAMRWHTTTLRS